MTVAEAAAWLFPTRVGVIPIIMGTFQSLEAFSHASGSVPISTKKFFIIFCFFPHTWECAPASYCQAGLFRTFSHTRGSRPSDRVTVLPFFALFPTRVGVSLNYNKKAPSIIAFSHASESSPARYGSYED